MVCHRPRMEQSGIQLAGISTHAVDGLALMPQSMAPTKLRCDWQSASRYRPFAGLEIAPSLPVEQPSMPKRSGEPCGTHCPRRCGAYGTAS